jgi:iron complex transport system permease protein
LAGGALGIGASAGPALVGAVGVLLLVWGLSSRRGVIDPVTMILIGVIVSVILGSATLLVASQMADRGFATARWMMGSLRDDLDRADLVVGSGIALVVLGWSVVSAGSYDASALGDDEARSVGVRLGRVRVGQLVGAGVLTTVSIVLAGPIGFVGLVSPHLVRLVLGARHNGLLIGSAMVGASLVLGADVVARFVRTDAGLIPVGVLTSLVGGPIFLVLLLKERRTGAGN